MEKIVLFLLEMVSFMMISCGVSSQEAGYRQINMDEAMTDDGKVIVERQFRYPMGQLLIATK